MTDETSASEPAPAAADPPPPAPKTLSGLRLVLTVLGLAAIFGLKELVFWDPPLTFTVGTAGDTGVLHDWESAPEAESLPLRFSDGTLVTLEPRTRARVVAIGRAGAQIVMESGRARVDVKTARFRVPGESPWRVRAGAFSIETKGARFDVDWEPRSDALALGVFEGSVDLHGCDGRLSQQIGAGQGSNASCREPSWQLVSASDALAPVRSELDSVPSLAPPGSLPPVAPAAGAATFGAR